VLRPARLLSSACVAGALTLVAVPWVVPQAAAEQAEGTITVVVDLDVDGDGIFDEIGDVAQPGVDITIRDASGKSVTGPTDEQGRFVVRPAVSGLSGGRYFVVADIPAGLDLVPVPEGEDFQPLSTTVDVSTEDQLVRLGVATRPASEPPPDEPAPEPVPDPADAPAASTALAAPGPRFAVGDRVWRDLDREGRQDRDEPGAVAISVQLLDAGGAVLRSTKTDASGRYVFDDLPAGLYSVRFGGISSEYRLSPTGVGSAAGDSDPDYTGITPPFRLAVGAAGVRAARSADQVQADYLTPTVDAGIAPLTYAVASIVWQDQNGNGMQDVDEPADSARVTLIDRTRNRTVATTHTDDAGKFAFAALPAGEYQLRFSDLGEHRRLTTPRVGGSAAIDSDPQPTTGLTDRFRLEAGQAGLVPAADVGGIDADFVDTTHSAGLVGSYTISNRVWADRDGDGTFSSGESGIKGVLVELLGADMTVVASTRTTASGTYRFDVPAGQYRLRFSNIPPGLHVTAPGVGGDRSLDSDVYSDLLTAPLMVGENHPVEDAVGAGLTRSISSTATTPAPSTVSAAAVSGVVEPLGRTGGPSPALPVAGVVLVLLGAGLLLRRRLRRH